MPRDLARRLEKLEKAASAATACSLCAGEPRYITVERITSDTLLIGPCKGCGSTRAILLETGWPSRERTGEPAEIVGRSVFGFALREWQRRAWRSFKRWTVLVVHRRGGKTTLGAAWLLDQALNATRPAPRCAFVSPYYKQSRLSVWQSLAAFASRIPGAQCVESDLVVKLPNGGQVRLFGADNPDSLRGQYFDAVVLDEVAHMRSEVWGEIIRPALADREGAALFIGTPRGTNVFSEIFHKALADPAWCALRFLPADTKALPEAELFEAQRTMTEAQYRQEFECDFSAANDNAVVSLDVARAAAVRGLRDEDFSHAPRVLGVDVARFGSDRTVLFPRQGLAAFKPTVVRDLNTMQVADLVVNYIGRFEPHAVFVDATGVGAGVVDRLHQLGYRVIPVESAGRPTDLRYANKRAEMWLEMANWLANGGAIPNLEPLIADLTAPTYGFNAAQRVLLESKDSIRSRGLPSPDLGDALALTFATPVSPSALLMGQRARGVQRAKTDYDVLAAG